LDDSQIITIEPGKRSGKACIRGLRITVWDILGWLGAGMTEAQILEEHPDLEKADFPAVYQFAAETGRRVKIGWARCWTRISLHACSNGSPRYFPERYMYGTPA